MNKAQYKESCSRLGVPYYEEDYFEKSREYIRSILEQSMSDKEEVKPSLGVKFDKNKPMWSLVPPGPMEEIVKVLTYGANKYSPDNWQHVNDPETRYFNAAMRHIWAWRQGEYFDEESHASHLAHAVCCLLFLLSFDEDQDLQNDHPF